MSTEKSFISSIMKPALVLFLTCFLVTLAVASTNELTAGRIDAINTQQLDDTMRTVIEADRYEDIKLNGSQNENPLAYRALDASNKLVGYIFITSTMGYGGEVSVMTGIRDGVIAAVEVIDCSNETPGLGQNARSPEFTGQFNGQSSAPSLVKGVEPGIGEIKALTGATVSSRAVNTAVEEAMELYMSITEGSGENG